MFGVRIAFFSSTTGWSKGYVYKSKVKYKIGDIVVVPTGTFYSVGRVTGCKEGYEFKPEISYKSVIQKVEI
jgi:hypothetical protein